MNSKRRTSYYVLACVGLLAGCWTTAVQAGRGVGGVLGQAGQTISNGGKEMVKRANQGANDAAKDAGKVMADIDPTIALRRELERARAEALKTLPKLDSERLLLQVQAAIEQPLAEAIR